MKLVLDWLARRSAFIVAVASFAVGQKCAAEPLPGRDVNGFSSHLGEAGGLEVEAKTLRWESSRGMLADTFLGRRLLFLARTQANAPADVYRARVRVSYDGQPLHIEAIKNLTETPAGEEAELVLRGEHAAFIAFSEGLAQGITVLDLAGAVDGDLPGGWLNRQLLHFRSMQQADSWFGIGKTHLRLPPNAELQFSMSSEAIELRGKNPARYTFESRQLATNSAAVRATRQPLGSGHWLHTLADLLREEFGSESVFRLALYGFGLGDAWHQFRSAWLPLAVEAAPAVVSPNPRRDPSEEAAAPWPPAAIAPLFEIPQPLEGRWQAARPSWQETVPEGQASLVTTFFRPDVERPYVKLNLVALDMRRLELRMEAGYEEPKPKTGLPGPGRLPDDPSLLKRLRATFNGGFKSLHGDYGMVVERRVLVPPVADAATVVLTPRGETGFGVWPRGTSAPDDILSLRQNLEPLIHKGVVNLSARTTWGTHSVSDGVLTERSALCLAENGHVYYAFGDGLSASTLARGLKHAGCRFAMHLDMNPHHCGFFYHDVPSGQLDELKAEPAFEGIEIGPKRFAQWSSKDFFYVLARQAPSTAAQWLPSPGQQPEPAWLPALTSQRKQVGALTVQIERVEAGRVRYAALAGGLEPVLEGKPAPVRELSGGEAPLFALNLGHTTNATRYGLAFQPQASLPLRRAYATLLIDGEQLEVLPSGQRLRLGAGQLAVQLPELMVDAELLPRGSERGSLRRRGALCILPDGSLAIASVRHDSSDVLALTLRELGCRDALELDRGSQHELFLQRAGTAQAPQAQYATTVLLGFGEPMKPRTFEWGND